MASTTCAFVFYMGSRKMIFMCVVTSNILLIIIRLMFASCLYQEYKFIDMSMTMKKLVSFVSMFCLVNV